MPFLVPRQYQQGDVIFREGEAGDRFYIVETGNVAIHRRPSSGGGASGGGGGNALAIISGNNVKKDDILKVVTQGEYFGELALLRGDPRAATATVERGGAFILSLSREDFTKHMGPLQSILDREAVSAYGVQPGHLQVSSDGGDADGRGEH